MRREKNPARVVPSRSARARTVSPIAARVAFTALVGAAGCHANDGAAPGDAADPDAREEAKIPNDAAPEDAGPGKQAKLGAANFQVSVLDAPAWPESKSGAKRLGYLRAGATVMAYDKPIVNDECKEGWFALVAGGYVCGKAVTFDLTSARVRLAPKGPDLRAGMPYRYGVNLSDDTPLYRRVLGNEERKKYEPWLIPKPPPTETADESDTKDTSGAGSSAQATPGASTTSSTSSGAASNEPLPTAAEDDPEQPKKRAKEIVDAGAKDAGPPRLKELRGHGVLVRKMVRGFYLALDRDFKAANARWWRTTFGFAVPFERIMVQPGVTKHHGAWFMPEPLMSSSASGADAGVFASGLPRADAGDLGALLAGLDAGAGDAGSGDALSVGFATHGYAAKVELAFDEKTGRAKVTASSELPKRSAVLLTGPRATVDGVTYAETSAGFWVRPGDLIYARPQTPPDLAANEKWIDVDITRQALVAFEGTTPVFATLVSTGRRNPQDKEHDFPTPQGTFHVREKHVTTTMDGDVASDGPYSIEDVPWVMYFEGSYALHGAFWHDQFGHMRSHGCVNLAPDDARTLFAWSLPHLPEGWHGVMATDDHPGSRIVIHEDAVPTK